jgi:hypothetical protein
MSHAIGGISYLPILYSIPAGILSGLGFMKKALK